MMKDRTRGLDEPVKGFAPNQSITHKKDISDEH